MRTYCVDLEIAKELKENGFPQDLSQWHWHLSEFDSDWDLWAIGEPNKTQNCYSAPNSDEILKELPVILELENGIYFLYINCLENGYNVYYQTNCGDELIEIFDTKLSNALAKGWMQLKKEGHIK